jgi:hypothetical protein
MPGCAVGYGGWKTIEDIPHAPEIKTVSNVEHLRAVARCAHQLVQVLSEVHKVRIDLDKVLAAYLLHEVGKGSLVQVSLSRIVVPTISIFLVERPQCHRQ